MQSNRLVTLLPLAFGCIFPAPLVSASGFDSSCSSGKISVRLPPYMDPALNATNTSSCPQASNSTWEAPPSTFLTGTWYITQSSQNAYRTYGNFQWDLWPVIPTCEANSTAACPPGTVAGVLNEITTWVPNDNKTALYGAIGGGNRLVASNRAYNTPRRLNFPDLNSDWDAVFDNTITEGGPAGFTQTWSVIYWGWDLQALPFMIVHEGVSTLATGQQAAPCIDVISMNPAGLAQELIADVFNALEGLGNHDLTAQIEGVAAVKWDSILRGGPAICGERCLSNKAS